MNYSNIYQAFIENRRSIEPALLASGNYKERHHIQPVSMGGSNEKSNLISLTARDHYFAHCCLAKIHGGKMWSALFAIALMTKTSASASYFLRGRMVGVARSRAAGVRSESMTDLWASGEFKRERTYVPHSEATKLKMSQSHIGKAKSAESIAKRSATRRISAAEFELVFIETGVTFSGTQAEFVRHSGMDQPLASCLTSGKIVSAKGWMLIGGNVRAIKRRDPTVRRFANKNGEIFVGTTYEFRTRFGLDAGVISNLVNGKNRVKSFKGWTHEGEEVA